MAAASAQRFRVRRIYEDDPDLEAHRVLVDRLWPRGLRKDDAHFDDCADSSTA